MQHMGQPPHSLAKLDGLKVFIYTDGSIYVQRLFF